MMRAIFRKLLQMTRKDKELEKMKRNGQLSSIQRNFEALYDNIMKKGQNYIYTARTKMSKQIVELIFLSQECRALFDWFVDRMI